MLVGYPVTNDSFFIQRIIVTFAEALAVIKEDVEKVSEKLSKEELVELVNKIYNPKLSDEEVSGYIEIT